MLAVSKHADPYGMSTLISQGLTGGCGWRLLIDGTHYDDKTFSEGGLDGISEKVFHEIYHGVDEESGMEWCIEFSDNSEDFGIVEEEPDISSDAEVIKEIARAALNMAEKYFNNGESKKDFLEELEDYIIATNLPTELETYLDTELNWY